MVSDFWWILSYLYCESQPAFLDFVRSRCKDCHLLNFEEHIQTTLPWLTATPAYRQAGVTTER